MVSGEEWHANTIGIPIRAEREVGDVFLESSSDFCIDRESVIGGCGISVEERVCDILAVKSGWDSEVVRVSEVIEPDIEEAGVAGERDLGCDQGGAFEKCAVAICAVVDCGVQSVKDVVDSVVASGWED